MSRTPRGRHCGLLPPDQPSVGTWLRRGVGPGCPSAAVVAGAAVLLVAGATGSAVAYVAVGGQGTGRAPVSPPERVTVRTESLAGLYPGGPMRRVDLSITNPADLPFTVTGVAPDLDAMPEQCPADVWSVEVPEELPTVPAAGTTTVPIAVTLTSQAPESCQGKHLSLTVTVSGRLE